jgi:preprotein translocase subunit SecG
LYSILIVAYVFVCIFLVLTVLLQQGKGAEIGAVFGSSDTIFGSAGPVSFLHKVTSGLAVLFMVFALVLTYLSAHKSEDSVMKDVQVTTVPGGEQPSEVSKTKKDVETTGKVIPEEASTVPEPETAGEKSGQVSEKKTNTVTGDTQSEGNHMEDIAPSTARPESSNK